MKKRLLALTLGLIALPAIASDKYPFNPQIDTQVVQKIDILGNPYKVIQITVSGLRIGGKNFKGNKFGIRFNATGTAIEIEGKSYTRKTLFGKHYRYIIKEIVQLPAPVPARLWGKHKSYNNNSKYFSYYDHNTNDTLVITIPVAEYISDVEVDENGQ